MALVAFGVFLGAAVLAKGPVGIVLCGGAVLLWALFTKRWRDAFRLFHPAAIVSFCVTALPWYILCARRNPDFLHVFLIEHNFQRFLTPEFHHSQPFWYYVPTLLVVVFPWTAIFLWSLLTGALRLIRSQKFSASGAFLIFGALFCIVFFSASQSKLPGYILPAVPALGLLLARSCTTAIESRGYFGLALLMAAALYFGAGVYLGRARHITVKIDPFLFVMALVLFTVWFSHMLLALSLVMRKIGDRSLVFAGGIIPLVALIGGATNVLELAPFEAISVKFLATSVQHCQVPIDEIAVVGLPRSTRYGLSFYLRREIEEWNGDSSHEAYVLSKGPGCREAHPQMKCSALFDTNEGWSFLRLQPAHSVSASDRSRN